MSGGQHKPLGSVPNPIPIYKDKESISVRDRLVQHYGEGTVQWAEIAVVIQLMFAVGIVKPREFIELVEHQCKRTDVMRARAAGFDA